MPIDNGMQENELAALFQEISKTLENENRLCDNLVIYDATDKTITEYGGDKYSASLDMENNLLNRKMNGGR